MKITLTGWKCRNIRGLRNIDINLRRTPDSPYPITFIMMPNGQGKTTTMKLLHATLSGSAEHWSAEQVREYRPVGSTADLGSFDLSLLINGVSYVLTLRLDYRSGTVAYLTSSPARGGQEPGRGLPSELLRVFSEQFVRRFIFDGELVGNILNSTRRDAEDALRYLYKLDRLSDLRSTVDAVIEAEQSASQNDTDAKTAKGLSRNRNARDRARDIHNQNLIDLSKKQSELGDTDNKIQDAHRRLTELARQDEAASRRLEELANARKQIDKGIERGATSLLNLLRDPALASPTVHTRLSELAASMERLKLPENTSRQFFVELAEADECVCGRPLGDSERQAIRERAEGYLANDEYGVVNSIKLAVARAQHDESVLVASLRLKESIVERRLNTNEEDRILAQQGGEAYQKLQDELRDLQTEQSLLRSEETVLRQRVEDSARDLLDAERKLQQATETVRLVQCGNLLKAVIAEAEERALHNLKQEIMNKTNEKLAHIIRLEEIRIDDISGYLLIHERSGISMGQALATAYSYLASLFFGAAFELPFVVDSPAGALDLEVRREVASMLASGLFSQLVLLVISSERDGLATPFYGRDDTLFLTVIQNEAGVDTVSGIEAFNSFQSVQSV